MMAAEKGGSTRMEEGVLCLKWRDHRSTFLRMLSSIRKKGVYCDVTLVCEGKFYPVHQLVLSTCSEYFQQMFEVVGAGASRMSGHGRAAGPLMVVLAGVSPHDLEAILEYIYAGEATILQGDLARFLRAAESLKVRGLAEPPPPAPTSTLQREAGEGTKRSLSLCEDTWEAKRRKESGDYQKIARGKEALPDIVSPAQLASVELAPEAQCELERGMATGTPGDLPGAVAPLSPLARPQIKYEEVQVKDEPQHHEDEEEKQEREGDWSHHHQEQHHQQQEAATPGEGAEATQLLGFCDPGLTYLAHTSGLGAVADPGHMSHHLPSLHPRRMGRPTSEIWLHYTTERAAGRTAVYCRYCAQKYGYPNATKMKIHTVKCTKCPEEVRRQFESTAKPDMIEGQDSTSGRLGVDGSRATKPDLVPQYQSHRPQQATDRLSESISITNIPKSGLPREDSGAENPSASSKADFHSHGNSSHKNSQNLASQEVFPCSEGISAVKPKQRQYPNQEKSGTPKLMGIKQHSCPSSPEKSHSKNVIPSSKLQQQHSKPLATLDDKVSLRPERLCHHPVF